MDRCPFIDPEFIMSVDEPCPVCGMLGFDWPNVSDKCVGDVVDTDGPPSPKATAHE